jgi:phospholipase/carboxylesterase
MIHIESSALFACQMRWPEQKTSETSSPLIVGLAGGGGKPEDFITFWDQFSERNFVYAVPQAPYPLLAGGEPGFDWAMWPTGEQELINKATELSEKYIVKVVQDLTSRFNIGDVYLMGFSQGAIFAYLTGIKHHHIFKGLICMSGPGLLIPLINPFSGLANPSWLSEEFIQEAGELRVFITHGKDERAAPYEMGITSKDILIKHGYDVTFRDFDGGHSHPPWDILTHIDRWIEAPHKVI